MRLLLDNILSTATLSSLHEDSNNPLTNLYHAFLRNRYQSEDISDTITIEFPDPVSINSFYFGYTNAESLAIQFLNADGDIILENDNFELATEDGFTLATEDGFDLIGYDGEEPEQIESFHFDPITVKTILIYLSGSENVYLGGCGVGTTYAPPSPSDNWIEPLEDRSIVSESQAGQVLQEYVEPLRAYEFSFQLLTRTELNELRQTFIDLGRGKPIWIELVPDHDEIIPLYGSINADPGTDRARMLLSFTLKFKEAR